MNPPGETILYEASAPGINIYITRQGLTYYLMNASHPDTIQYDRIDMTLEGAGIEKENIIEEGPLPHTSDYYYAHCQRGILATPCFSGLRIRNVYPGIDWVLYNNNNQLKYDFIVHPGADPANISLLYTLAGTLSVDDRQSLSLKTPSGNIRDGRLCVFQGKQAIASTYKLAKTNHAPDGLNSYRVSFGIAGYNHSKTMVIDPVVTWATELDGAGVVRDVKCDAAGNVFVLGLESPTTNLPILSTGSGYHQALPASLDIVIYKFDKNGVLIWCCNYGGSQDESPNILAVTAAGEVYVTGSTQSTNIPTLNAGGFFQANNSSTGPFQSDAFILKFDAASNLVWATYFGGPESVEYFTSSCFDLNGNLILAGGTGSPTMPLVNGGGYYDNTYNGGSYDGFMAKFSTSTALLHSTFLGGSDADFETFGCMKICCDVTGNIWLAGNTRSLSGLPYMNNGGYFNSASNGLSDAVFAKFDNAFNLVWFTAFGGANQDASSDISVDRCGNIWILGMTLSQNLVTQNAGGYMHNIAPADSLEGFIVKLNSSNNLVWSTYLGGNKSDWFNALCTDGMNMWALGFTNSTDIPSVTVAGGFNQGSIGGSEDVMIYEFNQNTNLTYSTYFGNSNDEEMQTAVIDTIHSRLYFAGQMPVAHPSPFYMKMQATPSSYQATGPDDGFIAQLGIDKVKMPFGFSVHDTTLCSNTFLPLQSGMLPPGNYLWNTGVSTYSTHVSASGTYWVKDSAYCTLFTDTFHVIINPIPVLTLPTVLTMEEGGSVLITATSTVAGTYSWTPAGSLSCPSCLVTTATPANSTSYCLTVTTAGNCQSISCVDIMVTEKPCPAMASHPLPEAFSPNGDNNNDVYMIQGWEFCLKEFNFKIFDRWGEKLFETSDPQINWDGYYQAKPLNTGIYVYELSALSRHDEKISQKGTISLIR